MQNLFTIRRPPSITSLFPYTTLFRSRHPGSPRDQPGRPRRHGGRRRDPHRTGREDLARGRRGSRHGPHVRGGRSEEHTSELQSRENLVCRLLLEKKKKKNERNTNQIE